MAAKLDRFEKDGYREIDAVMANPHERGYPDDEDTAEEVGVDEHLSPPPLVEEDARERSDERVRQEQDGEGAGDRCRGGLALGREQDKRCQCGLKQTIAELPHEADREEPPEVANGENGAEIGQGRHERRLRLVELVRVRPGASTRFERGDRGHVGVVEHEVEDVDVLLDARRRD